MGTTTVSLSILAGITFGFLYILITGIKWASERLEGGAGVVGKDRCARCGVTFVDVDDGNCSMCGLIVCSHCAIHYQQSWLCTACVIKTDRSLNTSEWILSQFKKRFQSTVAVMRKYGSHILNIYSQSFVGIQFHQPPITRPDDIDDLLFDGVECKLSGCSSAQPDIPRSPEDSERESDVRDFVEKLTEHLIGDRLDNVRIDRVCSHPSYTQFMDKYEQVLSLTLYRLRSSIQMLIDGEKNDRAQPPREVHQQLRQLINEIIGEANKLDMQNDETEKIRELRSKTYEDILAIAVLNKASERFLNPVFTNGYDNLELSNGNKLGLFPELESEFEVMLNGTTNMNFPDYEKDTLYQDLNDNWHFEKRMDSGSSSVTMLIPSPNEVAKPKIGDVEVDELSDLSDTEVEPVHDIEDAYNSSKNVPRLSPIGTNRNKGFEELENENFAEKEFLHYREPAIPSIVEARNNVFKSLGTQSDDETDSEKDRGLAELTLQNPTKIKFVQQSYADRYGSGLRGREMSHISVRHLARNFSRDDAPQQKHSVNSLTCRNPARDHPSF